MPLFLSDRGLIMPSTCSFEVRSSRSVPSSAGGLRRTVGRPGRSPRPSSATAPADLLPAASPFRSAEEAWFWFVRCQVVRRDGARFAASSGLFRPCDPDDVYLAITTLKRQRVLTSLHLETLGRFGLLGRPPDSRCREQERAARLWDEALDRLTTPLREKGIVC
jgi:hypothetical protein